jgi:AcrR family transcriptional regulator
VKKPRQAKTDRKPQPKKPRKSGELTRGPGKFTAEKRAEFLAHYATGLTVRQAARKTGVSTVTVFKHVRRDEAFAALYRETLELNLDAVEDAIHDLAVNGRNLTAMFGLLRAKRPTVWRENVNFTGSVEHSFAADFATAMSRMTTHVGSSATTH